MISSQENCLVNNHRVQLFTVAIPASDGKGIRHGFVKSSANFTKLIYIMSIYPLFKAKRGFLFGDFLHYQQMRKIIAHLFRTTVYFIFFFFFSGTPSARVLFFYTIMNKNTKNINKKHPSPGEGCFGFSCVIYDKFLVR